MQIGYPYGFIIFICPATVFSMNNIALLVNLLSSIEKLEEEGISVS